ncbi:hypothetical protein PGT21_032275 [Puccinia graminis f. sp. tritici]|uniref:Uncharacterized protein n=1 Tax=Puccinia graminis f. sp. tritici TaxID=56615 RepID=A0A5B0NTE7_PUCGR|nr:hypothetical protein PGT21_032275 [Puccinia graminis f. sp. tritici]
MGSISDLLNTTITEPDIARAIKSLEPLGSGYSIITIGSKKFIRSVPAELDNDSLVIFDSILSAPQAKGYTTDRLLQNSQNWTSERVKDALNKAVIRDSMLWVDAQASPPAKTDITLPSCLSLKIANHHLPDHHHKSLKLVTSCKLGSACHHF